MARPLGTSQEVPQWVREQGGTPTRIKQTPECDEASKRNETTGRSQAPRSNQTTRPAKSKPMRGSHDNPGRERPGEDREEVNSTRSRERTERPHPHGNLNRFLEERRHWLRQKSTDRPRGARKANPKSEIVHKRLNSTRTEWVRHNRPGERERTLAANPSDDPSTKERDEWKARTRIEWVSEYVILA